MQFEHGSGWTVGAREMTTAQTRDLRRVYRSALVLVEFKDAPFDEVKGCFVSDDSEEDRACWEEECRGRMVKVFSDPLNNAFFDCPPPSSGCTGPFYAFPNRTGNLCRHLITDDSVAALQSQASNGQQDTGAQGGKNAI